MYSLGCKLIEAKWRIYASLNWVIFGSGNGSSPVRRHLTTSSWWNIFYTSFLLSSPGILYPIVTHWAWSSQGWLSQGIDFEYNNTTMTASYQDFAGSGVVHLLGGTASLIAAIFLGPRIGRFDDDGNDSSTIKGHSMPVSSCYGQ